VNSSCEGEGAGALMASDLGCAMVEGLWSCVICERRVVSVGGASGCSEEGNVGVTEMGPCAFRSRSRHHVRLLLVTSRLQNSLHIGHWHAEHSG